MKPWQFIVTDDPVAVGVLIFLSAIFLAWLLFLIRECFRLRGAKKEIRNSEDVGVLEEVLKRQIVLRRTEASSIDPEQKVSAEKQEQAKFLAALEDFSVTVGAGSDRSILATHIRAIFEAGWNNSQLQIEPLIKNTSRRLFSRNSLLRSILSLFIIIGLLGTLFGLAHSLAELLPLMPDGNQLTNTAAAQGLANLLSQLRGAFAPSIWGVSLTIVGVLIFSFYLKSCQSLIVELERLTLTVWVPRLYPNPFQQQLTTLIQTEDLIQKNRAHVETVADFASHIKEDFEGFGAEIKKAKSTLVNLNQSSTQINEFATSFAKSVEKLTPFQKELGQLYSRMMADSKVFQEGVTQSLFNTTEVQRQARDTLIQQSEQLTQVIGRLRSYENTFIDSQQELDKVLQAVMIDARKAYQDIGKRNEEIVGAIDSSLSVPLREDLAVQLAALNDILTTKLTSVVNSFGRFETPIQKSAERFEQIVGTIDSRAGELMARLQHEYQKQNEANVEQLQRLENLNQKLVSFMDTLTGATSKQETAYASLSATLPGVQEKLITLNDNLREVIVEGFPSVTANDAIDTRGLEKQIKENTTRLVTELDKLVQIGDEIRKTQSKNGRREQPQPSSPVMVTTEISPSRTGLRARIGTAWRKLTRRKP
jgi:hypothetical protein